MTACFPPHHAEVTLGETQTVKELDLPPKGEPRNNENRGN